MNYAELMEKALNGRSVTAMAKIWGVPQNTLHRYMKGERMPDFSTALKIAEEAGIEPGEALKTLAAEEKMRKAQRFRLQSSFVQKAL